MKKVSAVIFVSIVLFWSALGQSQKPVLNAKVEIIDGIEFIHNSGIPMYPGKKIIFVEDLSIGGEDKDENISFFRPILSFVDDNENIYIIENQDQVLKVFSSSGKHIKTIGARGSGPGEFQMLAWVTTTRDGDLMAIDPMARRTSFFDSSGQFKKSFKWKMGYYNFIMCKNSSYIIGERAYSGTTRFGFFIVKEIDFEGKEVRSYGGFTMPEPLIVRTSSGTYYSSLPVSHRSIFSGDRRRNLFYHCLNNKYIIEVYNSSGKLFRKIDRPYKPVPFTKKEAEEYRARFKDHPSEEVKKVVKNMRMPKVKNVISRMHVDDKNNLWVRTNETKIESGKILTAYDIFNPDGHYHAKIWTPILPFIFRKGKMYRMAIDENTGYRTLKRYKVVWE